ncbi:ligase-associated DNA damage response exonuclease [Penaeicola halotolerans]|uniref:ligase-associated DNA damage response exonuclease n=1 Tax=Penaeicola halotolerans TaxID=2793196 RepID=UPI001CF855E6|nr:ligase-associated DNA damage response exonuclease [Penaeicola halotolerans]
MALIELTQKGLFCQQADVYIDPWRGVDKAIVTHAHADHARWGSQAYLAHQASESVLKLRLGKDISVESLAYDQPIHINGVKISLHPAGHIPGSAQVRLEYAGEVWVISGDYKTYDDGLSTPFEPVKCHHFVSECTFGLPIYQWEPQEKVFADIHRWWAKNQEENRASVIFGYSLGKAQRILHGLNPEQGKIFVHPTIAATNEALKTDGLILPDFEKAGQEVDKNDYKGSIIIAQPNAMGTSWMKKFGNYRTAVCSGWMSIRGAKRRQSADIGFVLSDHADWPGLNTAIKATAADRVYLTHGSTASFGRYLREQGLDAVELTTLFGEEEN